MDTTKAAMANAPPPAYGAPPAAFAGVAGNPPPYSATGYPAPSIGFQQPMPSAYQVVGGGTSVNYVTTQQPTHVIPVRILVPGTCPACRVGHLSSEFTLCGVLCALFFFPFGFICCALMTQRRCSACGISYS